MAGRSTAGSQSKLEILRARPLAQVPWLVHGFSTRTGGSSAVYGGNALNLGYTAHDVKSAVERNRRAFAATVVLKSNSARTTRPGSNRSVPWPLVTLRQIHSDLIHCISEPSDHPLAGDGLITRTPGILLAVLAADCLPIIVVDRRQRAVGVFHAGWRGTLKRIAEKGVGEMRRHFGSRPRELNAVIGPGIRNCCYQVGSDIKDKFEGQFSYTRTLFRETKEMDEVRKKYPLLFLSARAPGHSELPKKLFLDLAEADRRQLIEAGIPARNIFDLNLCTSCRPDLFFSHREQNGRTGRMMAAAGIRPSLGVS